MTETSELDPRVRCERDPETHIARLTIDNPDRRNAYDPPMRRAMRTHLDEIATDDDIKVVILRGTDGVFSTGADMANSYAWYGNDPNNRRPSQRRRLGVDRTTPAGRVPRGLPRGRRPPLLTDGVPRAGSSVSRPT